jgi:hypothetical protein
VTGREKVDAFLNLIGSGCNLTVSEGDDGRWHVEHAAEGYGFLAVFEDGETEDEIYVYRLAELMASAGFGVPNPEENT